MLQALDTLESNTLARAIFMTRGPLVCFSLMSPSAKLVRLHVRCVVTVCLSETQQDNWIVSQPGLVDSSEVCRSLWKGMVRTWSMLAVCFLKW